MSKFNYEEFFIELENDLTVFAHNLPKIIYDAPNAHNKILKRWTIENHKLHQIELVMNKVFSERFHFYRHGDFEINITSNDIAKYYVKKDELYLAELKKFNKQALLVETIDKWMKKAERIGYEIKNAVEVLKYLNGS